MTSRVSAGSWGMLLLLGAGGFLFYFDRQVLSLLKTTISGELGFSNTDYGYLVTSFLLPYTVSYLFAGRIVDRWGTRTTLWLFITGMSLASMGAGVARNFGELAAARVLLGIAESGVMPAVLIAVTQWFPPERRATAFTLHSAMLNCGGILAPPLVAAITAAANWRIAFVAPGLVGLFVALALRAADRQAPFAVTVKQAAPPLPRWQTLFASPGLRRVILARMCSDPLWTFVLYWHAAYLQERLGLSLDELGKWIWVLPAFSVVATLVLGGVNDHLVRRGQPPFRARLRLLGAITVIAPLSLLLPWIHHPILAVAALMLVYGMCNAWLLLTNLMIPDVVSPRAVGTSFGLVAAGAGVTSILFNLAAGPLIDAYGHTAILTVGAFLHPCALLIVRRITPGGPEQAAT